MHPKSFQFVDSSRNFIAEIEQQLQHGFGFVPLIGTGLSVPSGIPVIRELKDYLGHCISVALGAMDKGLRRWNPRTDDWPPFHDASRPRSPDWALDLWSAREYRLKENPTHPELPVFQEALGAAAEWRSSLQFLSRLRTDTRTENLWLDAPDNNVIDTFFLHITSDKTPSLGHRMMSLLADALKFNIVLTTNFDELIERAFAVNSDPLTVFEVHQNRELPPHRLVSGQRSIIKLHGGRYGLRADYSLDATPSDVDRFRAVSYLTGGRSDETSPILERLITQNHLLVLGFSGLDRRIRALLKETVSRLGNGFRIFWVCYSAEDIQNVVDLAQEHWEGDKGFRENFNPHSPPFVVFQTCFTELLLLETYQVIRRCLPSHGIPFPSASSLPIPPGDITALDQRSLIPSSSTTQNPAHPGIQDPAPGRRGKDARREIQLDPEGHSLNGAREELRNSLNCYLRACRRAPGLTRKLITVAYPPRKKFTTELATVFYQQQLEGSQCVWIDLDDIISTDDLFEQLLETISTKAGKQGRMPVMLARDLAARALEITRLTSSPERNWVLFVNARGGAGANSEEYSDDTPNGWLDVAPGAAKRSGPSDSDPGDHSRNQMEFLDLIQVLSDRRCPNVTIVFVCNRSERGDSIYSCLREDGASIEVVPPKPSLSDAVGETTQKALNWIRQEPGERESRTRFLLALTTMRRARYQSALNSPAFFDVESEEYSRANIRNRADTAARWVEDLEQDDRRVLDRKPGGFVWIHTKVRDRIRETLSKGRISQLREIHVEHARFYESFFLVSEDPAAMFEAVHHYCEASLGLPRESSDFSTRTLNAAIDLVRSSRPIVLRYGFSKSMCRKLTMIEGTFLARPGPDETKRVAGYRTRLYKECLKLKRAIAREVGEYGIAFFRHHQISRLQWREPPDTSRPGHGVSYLERHATTNLQQDFKKAKTKLDWIHWKRENGTLHIGARAYNVARRQFHSVYESIVSGEVVDLGEQKGSLGEIGDDLVKWARKEVNTTSTDNADVLVLGVIKTLKRHMQLTIAEAHLAVVHDGSHRDNTGDDPGVAYDIARDLAFYVSPDHRERLQWERQILKTQMAMWNSLNCHFEEAHRQLNGAAAILDAIEVPRDSLSAAIVLLTRAEIYIRQALKSDGTRGEASLWSYHDSLLKIQFETDRDRRYQSEQLKGLRKPDRFKTSIALLHLADGTLKRAAPILRRNRKNVWWATLYFARRLRVIELMLCATAGAPDEEPIYSLGLEAAPRGAETLADELLRNAFRLARLDIFQLATAVESYENCLRFLRLRLCNCGQSDVMPNRPREMQQQLESAKRELAERIRKREEPTDDEGHHDLEPKVRSYAARVAELPPGKRPIQQERSLGKTAARVGAG